MKSICIISQSHLCRNPRVLKEAIALAGAGYNVQVLTGCISSSLYKQDLRAINPYPIILQTTSDLSRLTYQSFADKFLNKIGRLLIKYLKIETGLSLGYGAPRYYNKAKSVHADLYICHQELATYIGTQLLSAGFKVAFDFEDWYSEDLLPEARAGRAINLLRNVESIALNKGIFCITTSNVLAKRLSASYSAPQPQVIYNVFPSALIPLKKKFSKPVKLFWFSQTIGAGRGLEPFFNLLSSFRNPVEIHLLGSINDHYKKKLNTLLPGQHRLYFHDLVEGHKLAEKIATFDIGLSLELDTPKSRNYTITNKFYQYIQSGLPVIVSETEGQNEGFDKFRPGFKLSRHPSTTEVAELEKWLNNDDELQAARKRAIEATGCYNWENESKKILGLVQAALEK